MSKRKGLVIRITSDRVIMEDDWTELRRSLSEGGFVIIGTVEPERNSVGKWTAWLHLNRALKQWCNDCQHHTLHKYGSWANKGFKECDDCGRRTYR